MPAYIDDITINISSGTIGLEQMSFRPLIIDSDTVASGVVIATKLSDLTDAGFLTTDDAYDMASAMFAQRPRPQDIAVLRKADATAYADALTTLVTTFNSFYAVCIASRLTADIQAVGTWANSNKKMFFGCSDDSDVLTGRSVDREAYLIHDAPEDFPECAWVGKEIPKTPGSNTWKWKILSGQTAPGSTFTTTLLNTIRTNNGNALQSQGGVTFTNEGKCTSGEYIDIIIGQDWVEDQIRTDLLSLFTKNDKIPMDDTGIALVEGVARGVLKRAGANGIVAAAVSDADRLLSDDKQYMYQVTVPARADLSSTDRANRNLTGVKFVYTTAGAIHKTTVTGYIQV